MQARARLLKCECKDESEKKAAEKEREKEIEQRKKIWHNDALTLCVAHTQHTKDLFLFVEQIINQKIRLKKEGISFVKYTYMNIIQQYQRSTSPPNPLTFTKACTKIRSMSDTHVTLYVYFYNSIYHSLTNWFL